MIDLVKDLAGDNTALVARYCIIAGILLAALSPTLGALFANLDYRFSNQRVLRILKEMRKSVNEKEDRS